MFHLIRWSPEIKLGDIIALLGFTATVGGVIYAALQVRHGASSTRADIVMRLLEGYFGDQALRRTYYRIDYQQFKFDPARFQMSEEEPDIDRLGRVDKA